MPPRALFLPTFAAVASLVAMPASGQSPVGGQLENGPLVLELLAGVTAPAVDLANGTLEDICGLRLSTVWLGGGADPDFEGGSVVVRNFYDSQDLLWTQLPASGDGVEEVVVTAPNDAACMPAHLGIVTIHPVFDAVPAGSRLTVTPLNRRDQMIGAIGQFFEADLPLTVPLVEDEPNVSLLFANSTAQGVCDLELEVLGGPDFEGDPVEVHEAFEDTDLGWSQTPAPDDGVKEVKAEAPEIATPDAGGCVPAVMGLATLGMSFDAVPSGASLKFVPTNNTGHAILFGGYLTEGGLTIPLTEGLPKPGFTLVVNTGQPVCDLELDTEGGPDIEGGPVIVKSLPGDDDLGWTQLPASANGVKAVRAMAPELTTPGSGGCLIPGLYSLNITFDGAGPGEHVRVMPSSSTGHRILYGGKLEGGPLPVPLTDGATMPGYGLANDTTQPICDILLSTKYRRDGSDPDIEAGVIVKREPDAEDLGWVTTPAPADGVQEVKVVAPSRAACIEIGEILSVSVTLDTATADQVLTITPTNEAGETILGAGKEGHDPQEDHDFFPGYDGLGGATTGRLVTTNGLDVPVRGYRVSSPDVIITDFSTPVPGTFDPISGELILHSPIPPGGPIDYTITFQPAPVVDGPPPPLPPHIVIVELIPGQEGIPLLSGAGLTALAVILAAIGSLALARTRRSAWG